MNLTEIAGGEHINRSFSLASRPKIGKLFQVQEEDDVQNPG